MACLDCFLTRCMNRSDVGRLQGTHELHCRHHEKGGKARLRHSSAPLLQKPQQQWQQLCCVLHHRQARLKELESLLSSSHSHHGNSWVVSCNLWVYDISSVWTRAALLLLPDIHVSQHSTSASCSHVIQGTLHTHVQITVHRFVSLQSNVQRQTREGRIHQPANKSDHIRMNV